MLCCIIPLKPVLSIPVQLLEAFVGDLSGWHRNGSDEEELAGEWFSRAYSGMGGSDSFLYYLYDHETDINELEHIAVTFDHDPGRGV